MQGILIRDFYRENKDINSEIILNKDLAFHLLKVLRVQKGEKVKIFNGKGFSYLTEVVSLTKSDLCLSLLEITKSEVPYFLDVLFGVPKKEALESMIKMAVELGAKQFIPWKSDFSQMSHYISSDRFEKLVESALIQSNNPYEIGYKTPQSLSDLNFDDYQDIYFFTSQEKTEREGINIKPKGKSLLVIGPEGGFSKNEQDFFISLKQSHPIQLPTPILRSPTALAACFGYVLALK